MKSDQSTWVTFIGIVSVTVIFFGLVGMPMYLNLSYDAVTPEINSQEQRILFDTTDQWQDLKDSSENIVIEDNSLKLLDSSLEESEGRYNSTVFSSSTYPEIESVFYDVNKANNDEIKLLIRQSNYEDMSDPAIIEIRDLQDSNKIDTIDSFEKKYFDFHIIMFDDGGQDVEFKTLDVFYNNISVSERDLLIRTIYYSAIFLVIAFMLMIALLVLPIWN